MIKAIVYLLIILATFIVITFGVAIIKYKCECKSQPTYRIVLQSQDKYKVIYDPPFGTDRSVIDTTYIKRIKIK